METAVINQAKAARLAAEENVRRDVEVVAQVQFLVDQRDAQSQRRPDRTELNRLALEEYLAAVRRRHAGQDFHQRAFARAVLADHGQHFAAVKREAHVVQRPHSGKMLAQIAHLQHRSSGRGGQ